MKEPPVKMFIHVNLFALLLLSWCMPLNAAPSPEPLVYSNGDSISGFIANPSIYSYTIANQPNTPNKSQQQQVKNVYDVNNYNNNKNNNNNNNDNNANLMNIDSNTKANSNSNLNANSNIKYHSSNNNNNRNFYYTNNVNSKDTTTGTTVAPTQPAPINGCTLDRLAVYKVVLHTYWTRELFPKHYPDWRPSAQWTKTIGRTHDAAYALYHIGQQATAGVKQFSETGKSDILDSLVGEQQQQQQQQQEQITGNSFASFVVNGNQQQKPSQQQQQQQQSQNTERSVFDEFTVPMILNGAGRSEAKFFVDSNHSLVSLMTRIVPSPDWFIGVDSFQLCVGGSWIDTVTVEMDPLDAGTDNGFTFTAPNWPTSPQGVIYRITSRYPAHPAGSFFYPKNKRLPPIATFQFIKLKEYELSEVFNFAEDDRKYETVKTQTHLESEHNHVDMNNELSASIERERQNEISPKPTSESERDRIRSRLLAKMNPIYNNSNTYVAVASSMANVVPKNDKDALMQSIANSYQRSDVSATALKRRRSKRTRDCRVSHWSEWTACSKTCGIGEMHRYRKVIKHGKRGGRPCPALQESKWCGSEKGCHSPSTYFNWSDT